MCVKCGINNCGCSGKACQSDFTGDIIYDGLPIVCATDSSIDVASGEKLNDVIKKILVGLCPPVVTIPYLLREILDITVPDANPLTFGTSFVVPSDGTYHLRLDVRGTIKNDIDSNISLYNVTNSVEVIGPESFSLTAASGISQDVTMEDTIVMEDIVVLTEGDVISARVVGAIGNGSVAIFRTTIYAKRLS
tara:strand:+ start:3948 stop:4523 length:576 start_codon:yes stop_codon:yes gene_type:complete